jgi:hypothetical protein
MQSRHREGRTEPGGGPIGPGGTVCIARLIAAKRQQVVGASIQFIAGDELPARRIGRREPTALHEQCCFEQQQAGIIFGLLRSAVETLERIGETFFA